MKDHELAALVNDLTVIAREYGQAEQLRQRISQRLDAAVKPLQASETGYAEAFYEMCGLLGIGARNDTPANIYQNEVLPKLRAVLNAAPQAPGVPL